MFNRDIKADRLFSEKAIVVLSTEHDKEMVLDEF